MQAFKWGLFAVPALAGFAFAMQKVSQNYSGNNVVTRRVIPLTSKQQIIFSDQGFSGNVVLQPVDSLERPDPSTRNLTKVDIVIPKSSISGMSQIIINPLNSKAQNQDS